MFKVLDKGDKLEKGEPTEKLIPKGSTPLPFIGDVMLTGLPSGDGQQLLTRYPSYDQRYSVATLAFNARTGEQLPDFVPKTADGKSENFWNLVYGEWTSGKDGRVYSHANDKLVRYDNTGKPAPFSSSNSHVIKGLPLDRHTHNSTLFATKAGEVYMVTWASGKEPTQPTQALDPDVLCVRVFNPDGTTRSAEPIRVQGARVAGLAVDPQGNVFLGVAMTPADQQGPPAWVKGKLPADGPAHHPSLEYSQYASIIRFPPSGGAITLDAAGGLASRRQGLTKLALTGGKLLARAGLAPGKNATIGAGCACEVSRIDIDDYGRLYVPDIFRFCVLVLDGEGNEVGRFGSYGNMDSRGPGSPVPDPAIAFAWPLSVKCGDGQAFVADETNRRIVSVRLGSTVSETCDLK